MKFNRRWLAAGSAAVVLGTAATGTALAVSDDGDDTPITGDALEQASAAALAHTGGGTVTDTEVDDEDGAYEVEVTRDDGSEVDVHLDQAFDVVGEDVDDRDDEDGDGDRDDQPITGDALDQATAAALAHTGGGTVTDTEVDDDGGAAYEVEVTLDDGSQVDVHLDAAFDVVGEDVDD